MKEELPITTTLNAIRERSPCEDGWEKLLKHLGKKKADDEPLAFSTILESNGLDDALWCLRSLPEKYHGRIWLMACDFAERVLHIYEKRYSGDKRPRVAIETSRRYALGNATQEELAAARAAAGAAAWDAAGAAAWDAAWDAAWAAERKIQDELLVKYFG